MEFLLLNWGPEAIYQFGKDVDMDDWNLDTAWDLYEKVPNPPVGWITLNDKLFMDSEDDLPVDYFSEADIKQDLKIYRDTDMNLNNRYEIITDLDLYITDDGKLGEWLDRLRVP